MRCIGSVRGFAMSARGAWRCAAWLAVLLLSGPLPAPAQESDAPAEAPAIVGDDGPRMSPEEARRALGEPEDPAATVQARIAALERQRRAAFAVGDRGKLMGVLEALAELQQGTPAWARTRYDLLVNQYNYGNAQRAFQTGEALLAADGVAPEVRARTASMLAFAYANTGEREKGARLLGIAESAHAALGPDSGGNVGLRQSLLSARSEVSRLYGDLDASTAAAREGYLLALRDAERQRPAAGDARRASAYLAALGQVSGGGGLYTYALVRQGRLVEARAICEAELARARLEDPRPDGAGAWNMRLANVLLAERRFDDALKAARSALAAVDQAGAEQNGMRVSIPKDHEVAALVGLQRWREADETYAAHVQAIQGDAPALQRFADTRLAALLAAKNGRIDAALEAIERTYRYRLRLYGARHPQTLEVQGIRGAIRLAQGSVSAALSDYEALFSAILDTPTGWVELEPVGRRGAYLSIAVDEYLRFVATRSREPDGLQDRKLADRATQVLDWLAVGATQHALNDSTSRLLAGSPPLAAALREWQDARNASRDRYRELNALMPIDPRKLSDDERKEFAARLKREREAAQAARERVEKLGAALAERFPSYADLAQPRILAPDALARLLARDEALVSIVPTRFAVFVSAVTASGERVLHASRWTDAELDRRVAALRRTLDVGSAGRVPPFDFRVAHELYRELLAPVESLVPADGSLIVAAQGSLASLPMAALVTAEAGDAASAPWLVRRFAVTQLPSASSLSALRRSGRAAQGAARPMSMLGFGDPQFGAGAAAGGPVRVLAVGDGARAAATFSADRGFRYAQMPPLPDTREELRAIAQAVGADPERDLVLGAAATRAAVLGAPLAGRRIVAFATHGLLPGEMPGLSKPALAMADTDDAGGPLLVLDDILALSLNADWVVLSACNTAGGERGGAAMSGLVRGFFFAGARSVLATHWAVDSVAARRLVSAVFAGANDARPPGRAQALRAAQRAMIDGRLGDAAYAHPFYWAPYALFGDPAQ